MVHVYFIDNNPTAVGALQRAFAGVAGVTVMRGDICKPPVQGHDVAIATAANSFGAMNGGVDGFVNTFLSARDGSRYMSDDVKEAIAREYGGEQPVGTCLLLPTQNYTIGWLAHAVTVRVPKPIPTTYNAYLAFRAVLVACRKQGGIRYIVCPMFCSGSGEMPHDVAARQMRFAFDQVNNFAAAFAAAPTKATAGDWQDIWRAERILEAMTTGAHSRSPQAPSDALSGTPACA